MSITSHPLNPNRVTVKPNDVAAYIDDAESSISPSLISAALAVWRQRGKSQRITAEGQSMRPLISDGDTLIFSHDVSTVRPGSVVIFRQGSRMVTHRVIRILPGSLPGAPCHYLTKGDNVSRFDPPFTQDDLLGHVLAIQGKGRFIALHTQRWRVLGWLIATVTGAAAEFHGWLRHLKPRWWHAAALPGTRAVRSYSHTILASVLKVVTQLDGRKS